MTIAVVGATGYTGRLVVGELLRRGLGLIAVGLDAQKLDALQGDFERRTADVRDIDSLMSAVSGSRALVSTVGPFVDHGEAVVKAAIAAGVHYIDTTGEQAFMRTVFDSYDQPARRAGVALVPAIGFDYVPGDMAAALAARELGDTPDRIDVFYLIRKAKASEGTKRTGMRIAGLPCLVWEEATLTERAIGSGHRRFDFPDRESGVALWPGGEPLTVPRHTGARNVATYMRMPKAASSMIGAASVSAPAAKTGAALARSTGQGPSAEDRARGFYEVVAEAWTADTRVRCVVRGTDMYGMTAAACAEALGRMVDPTFEVSGALAPSEAFAPHSFLDCMQPFLTWTVEP